MMTTWATGATFGFPGFKVFRLIVEDHPNHEFDDFTCYAERWSVMESGQRRMARVHQKSA